MLSMVKTALADYLTLASTCKISYPNSYVEWSLSNIYTDIVSNSLKEFNHERSFKLLAESEVDYVLDMMETRYKDFKKTEMLKPFFLKAIMTFRKLAEAMGLMPNQAEVMLEGYEHMDIDTTIGLLKKLKRLFWNRAVVVGVLGDVKQREIMTKLVKDQIMKLLDAGDMRNITLHAVEVLKQHLASIYDLDFRITSGIKNLYTEGLIFGNINTKGKMLFKFSNRDYAQHIVEDTNSLNNLIQMLQIIAMTNTAAMSPPQA